MSLRENRTVQVEIEHTILHTSEVQANARTNIHQEMNLKTQTYKTNLHTRHIHLVYQRCLTH